MIERLVHRLQLLGAPAEAQLARDAGFLAGVDEVALDYADALRLVTDCPQVMLSPDQRELLERLDDLLEELRTGRTAPWTAQAIEEEAGWQRVRRLAREALRALGEPAELPPRTDTGHLAG